MTHPFPLAVPPPSAPAWRTVLNIGCGPCGLSRLHDNFPPAAWREIRLDINPAVRPDIVASITDMPMLPTASVDAAWSSHSLEHLNPHEVPMALRECRRVLKPGGVLMVMVPDLQAVAAWIAEDKSHETLYVAPAGPITALDVVYGHAAAIAAGDLFMAHRTGFTPTVLGGLLTQAGFGPILLRRSPDYELIAIAHAPSLFPLAEAELFSWPLSGGLPDAARA